MLSRRKCEVSALHPHLDSVWYVEADESYRVERIPGAGRNGWVAVRTLSGEGRLELNDGRHFSLRADTQAFFRDGEIARYAACAGGWQFYWFVFDLPPGQTVAENRVNAVSLGAPEKSGLERCFMELGSASAQECALAEALFGLLLAQWQVHADSAADRDRREILGLLDKGRRERLSVAELAREAGMCERSFRSAVRRITGMAPKAYMLGAEMDAAMELLRTSDMSVSEIADSFGYASPFYFSRVFRNHFGLSPSQVRRGGETDGRFQ